VHCLVALLTAFAGFVIVHHSIDKDQIKTSVQFLDFFEVSRVKCTQGRKYFCLISWWKKSAANIRWMRMFCKIVVAFLDRCLLNLRLHRCVVLYAGAGGCCRPRLLRWQWKTECQLAVTWRFNRDIVRPSSSARCLQSASVLSLSRPS